jgi:multidrug efflux pump subunit AcrB
MGIVRFALRFPHTFYVLAALIVFLGVTAIRTMPTDIFPEINIPVVTIIWQYTGLSTPEMEQRVSTYSQYSISSNVNGIKDMESQTLNGLSVQKIFFQPDVNLDLAIAQIVSATNAIRALMPPGIQPPIVSLSSSEQVSPNFWTDPASGIPYYIAVQTPEPRLASLDNLRNTPVSTAVATDGDPVPGLLSNVATLTRGSVPTNSNQANIQPVYEVYASVQGRDLGGVSGDINKIVADLQPKLKPGNFIQIVGQIQSMNDSFRDLGIGLLFAAVFVFALMVVNYQNFGDPFVVILALPATLCGILVMLFITGTTLSVPSLMGAIMAVGVASANSILLVTFAHEQQLAGRTSFEAAIDAGHTRIRPVLMTAAAMIVGMLPMAIGGAGEEQNAALARAVIGGLLFATPTTLLVVPYLFAMLRRRNDGKTAHGVFEEDIA